METGKMKLALSAGALALSMALAGCGGGSSSSGTAQPTIPAGGNGGTPPRTDTTTTHAVTGVPSENERPAMGGALEGGTVKAGQMGVLGPLEITCPSGDADCVITVAADGTLRSTVSETTAVLTTAAQAQLMKEKEQETKDTAEAMRRADGVFRALDSLGTPPSVKVSWDNKAGAVKFESGTLQSSNTDPMTLTGWTGKTLEGSEVTGDQSRTQKVVIYSDLKAPAREDFVSVYFHPGAAPAPKYARGGSDAGAIESYRVTGLTHVPADDGTPAHLTIAASGYIPQAGQLDSHFPPRPPLGATGDAATITWTYGPADSDGDDTTNRFPRGFDGTFHGAAGRYECTGTCSVAAPVDRTAGYTFNGTWSFTPNAGAKALLTDVDHLHFGYWLARPNRVNLASEFDYEIGLINGRSEPYRYAGLPTTGSARYNGNAAGVFAIRAAETTSSGEFVADAELTATFRRADTSTLEGIVNNFRHASGGSTDMGDWLVELNRTPITGPSTNAIVAVESTATAFMGDTRAASAEWTANLFGLGGHSGDPAPTGAATHPTGVAGTFEADFTNARIAGAFGATLPPPSN